MYPWYRDSQIGVGQFCSPMAATIKTESGYNDCMLALDYAAQSKVRLIIKLSIIYIFGFNFFCFFFFVFKLCDDHIMMCSF